MADNTFSAKNWRDLIKPRKLEVDQDSLTPTYGKFVAEPLERGFGTTLGNSLRRVLLTSRPRLRAGDRQHDPGRADRHDHGGLAVLARAQGELPGHQRPRRSADGLRQAGARAVDGWLGDPAGRGRLRGEDHQGAADGLH